MMPTTNRDDFENWLFDMDDALDRFRDDVPKVVRERLDYSFESLEPLEQWILQKYVDTKSMLVASEANTVDGIARYIGETFRKQVGGKWNIRLDDPEYVYYGLPELTGFSKSPTPICPHTLATASADRRTGTFIRTVLENAKKRIQK
jgi:hypothetical protein